MKSISLEDVKKKTFVSGSLEDWIGKDVRIWSGEHGAWWRPEARSYTDDINQAWVLKFEKAVNTTEHCGPEKKISYQEVEQ